MKNALMNKWWKPRPLPKELDWDNVLHAGEHMTYSFQDLSLFPKDETYIEGQNNFDLFKVQCPSCKYLIPYGEIEWANSWYRDYKDPVEPTVKKEQVLVYCRQCEVPVLFILTKETEEEL